jgi:hypothetical protein
LAVGTFSTTGFLSLCPQTGSITSCDVDPDPVKAV